MNTRITDIHMHIIPGVDDGAIDFKMSLEMIEEAYKQGVRNIFCTSHNVYEKEDIERYKSKFLMLKKMSESLYHDLNLFMGCELLCAREYMEDILYGLEVGVFLPLGDSKFVLTELYPDATPQEARLIVESMNDAGWKPILAHTERYPALFEERTLQELINLGAMIQVNLLLPSLGMMTFNALCSADSVIIPTTPEFLSAKGLEQLLGTINRVRRHINPGLKIDGILITMVDNRTRFGKGLSVFM